MVKPTIQLIKHTFDFKSATPRKDYILGVIGLLLLQLSASALISLAIFYLPIKEAMLPARLSGTGSSLETYSTIMFNVVFVIEIISLIPLFSASVRRCRDAVNTPLPALITGTCNFSFVVILLIVSYLIVRGTLTFPDPLYFLVPAGLMLSLLAVLNVGVIFIDFVLPTKKPAGISL